MTQALHPEVVTAGDMLEGEAGAHPWLDAFLLFSKMIPQQQPFRFFLGPSSSLESFPDQIRMQSFLRLRVRQVSLITPECMQSELKSRSSNVVDYSHASEVVLSGIEGRSITLLRFLQLLVRLADDQGCGPLLAWYVLSLVRWNLDCGVAARCCCSL